MVCDGRYDSHAWSAAHPRTCEECGLVDLSDARLMRRVLDGLREHGVQVYDDRDGTDPAESS